MHVHSIFQPCEKHCIHILSNVLVIYKRGDILLLYQILYESYDVLYRARASMNTFHAARFRRCCAYLRARAG